MTNLTIDLNNMFMRSFAITGGYGANAMSFDNDQEIDQLVRKVATDITYIIRKINPSRVIFCKDDSSWRKSINIEENEGYKGQREKSSKVNWDKVFSSFNEFTELLKEKGFIVSKIKNAEADDLIALWVEYLSYKKGQHVIIVSADEDIRQLVNFFPYDIGKKAFITTYNPFLWGKVKQRKLYIPEYFEEWINEEEDNFDIFNTHVDSDKEDFKRLRDIEKIFFEKVNGNYIALRKLFCGDDGDNIPAFYTWINDKDKEVRITESKFIKIKKELELSDIDDLNDDKKLLQLENILAKISGKVPNIDVAERLKRQNKLVHLHSSIFPEEIVKTFNDQIEDQLKNYNIHPQNWNMNNLLEGSRFLNNNYSRVNSRNENSIFKDLDKINKNKSLF